MQFQAFLNGLPWNLTGGAAVLKMTDSAGNSYSFNATIAGQGGYYFWTVTGPVGNWTRAWQLQDSSGIIQVSRPIAFSVESSPS